MIFEGALFFVMARAFGGRICCVYLREHGISIDGFVVSGQACGEKVLEKPVHSFVHLPCLKKSARLFSRIDDLFSSGSL